jgi:hypothetical protein
MPLSNRSLYTTRPIPRGGTAHAAAVSHLAPTARGSHAGRQPCWSAAMLVGSHAGRQVGRHADPHLSNAAAAAPVSPRARPRAPTASRPASERPLGRTARAHHCAPVGALRARLPLSWCRTRRRGTRTTSRPIIAGSQPYALPPSLRTRHLCRRAAATTHLRAASDSTSRADCHSRTGCRGSCICASSFMCARTITAHY